MPPTTQVSRLVASLAVLVLLAGCRGEPEAGELVKSGEARLTNPNVSGAELEQLSTDNRAFAFDLYAQLRTASAGNLIFSPHSISTAMAMVYAGARGETEAELELGMRYRLGQAKVHDGFNALDLALQARGKGAKRFELKTVNALFAQKGYPFQSPWLDTLAMHYGAGVRLFDFKLEAEVARGKINDWVAYHTDDHIRDLLPAGSLSSDTRAVLTNAVSFNAGWAEPFEESKTQPRPFHRLDGSSTQVQMMRRERSTAFTAGEGYQAVQLPYEGEELALLLILPDAGRFVDFEARADQALVDAVASHLTPREVDLLLPRFTFNSGFSLKQALEAIGILQAFGDADLSGIDGSKELFISDVFHQGFIEVAEAGTKAAAATAVVIDTRSVASPAPVQLVVDRPFLFLIRDLQTGAVLFLGRVVDP